MSNATGTPSKVAFPILDSRACPNCGAKPCLPLAKSASETLSLSGPRDIPGNCPLKIISPSALNAHVGGLRRYSLSDILRIARLGPTGSCKPGTPTAEAVRQLLGQGKIAVIALPFGSE